MKVSKHTNKLLKSTILASPFMDNKNFDASKELKNRAKELRKNMTSAEVALWDKLRDRKLFPDKMRRQHPVHKFILDYYCHSALLAIEVDGGYHQEAVQKFYDEDRTEILREFGIKVIRFSNNEVIENIDSVVEKIRRTLGLF